ncbi:MAG: permease, partial [Planctomycetota bacterium]
MNRWILLADGPGFTGLLTDFNTTFWSAVLRIVEAMIAAAPYLVAGVFVAGFLRGIVGSARIRSIMGIGHWTGPLRAWGLGILLPICSLGALPVARELRRAGVPSGTVLSFVLVAPVLNPVSIIYGLSHIDPSMLIYFAVGTFAVSVGIGLLWNRLVSASKDEVPENVEKIPVSTTVRLKVVGFGAAKALVGPAAIDYGLALLAVGVLGAFLPHAALQTGLTQDNAFAPIIMGIVAIPVYVTPTEVMMHFGHIVRDGFSLGAAFALIVLGAGANVGVANWLRRDYGLRALAMFVAFLIGSTLVIGFTADRTLKNGNATQEDHTHAFDPFTRLAKVEDSQANIGWVVRTVWNDSKKNPPEIYGFCMLIALAVFGGVLHLFGEKTDVDRILANAKAADAKTPEKKPGSAWNPALSTTQLVAAGVVGILSFSVLALYIYYPSTDVILDDLVNIRFGLREAVME